MDDHPVIADDVRAILAQVTLDEPFDEEADLVAVEYADGFGSAPIGLFVGRTETPAGDSQPLAVLEHVILLPGAGRGKRLLALAEAWRLLCLSRGLLRAVCGIPKDKDRAWILRAAKAWGFRQYLDDAERTWWVKDF